MQQAASRNQAKITLTQAMAARANLKAVFGVNKNQNKYPSARRPAIIVTIGLEAVLSARPNRDNLFALSAAALCIVVFLPIPHLR